MLRSGFAAGVAAYLLWGLFPLYWPLLEPAGPVEILAHRILWSVVLLVAVLARTQGFRWVRELDRRRAWLLALAAALITLNWGAFIYGVNHGHVVETSLGYFINPLVTVALAVVVVGERLRRAQWAAVGDRRPRRGRADRRLRAPAVDRADPRASRSASTGW